jgi:integrase
MKYISTRPAKPKDIPTWDLGFVLMALTQPPYEPLHKASIADLTYKTYFLILLASGRRRSDLLAIDITRTQIKPRSEEMFLFPNVGFLPKTAAAAEAAKRTFTPIHLLALSHGLTHDDPDAFFCPVRAYQLYLKRTKSFRGDRTELFISIQEKRKTSLAVNTLTGWVKRLISDIYQTAHPETKRRHSIRPHDVRSLATSLAEASGASLDDIMKAGMWTSHNTFTSFYLTEVTTLRDQLMALSPLVVAQYRL